MSVLDRQISKSTSKSKTIAVTNFDDLLSHYNKTVRLEAEEVDNFVIS